MGLLSNGELFIWHKDKDVVKFIPGLEKMDNNFTTGYTFIFKEECCIAVGVFSTEIPIT